MEETMEALHGMVKSGKVCYLGTSYMNTWRFVEMNVIAEKNEWIKFIAMQDLYNLVYREEEREMIPYLAYEGIGKVPYSPLEKGKLACPLDEDALRLTVDYSKPWSRSLSDADKEITQRAQKIVEQQDAPKAQIT
ncbi:Aldo/keto reductase [Rhizopus microsporus ATCC 52813]|uniref:Aldo/keto reductase n=1 Tax=Rhizopus microsporus ATCC 52813 TaxID=1340429 RepID=A0A2G4T0B7_RHIZD|nr:Aldo/keto reductase [Rhizopus microsporus ATCC 52813]PHZ14444.1 Aldo/keto reductase [Rhizopus microsporus ATCC 52813]